MEKRKRIEELVALLNQANYAYEQENREIMSNFEYDALYDELKALEEETGFVMAVSPTVNAGYEVLSELPKERHVAPMLSLDKTKSVDALAEFLGDKEGMLSWKMDGLTNVLTYSGGELVKALTRGNGEIGENITNNAKVYKNIPLKIPYQGELVLRGESVITYSEFERINAEIEDVTAKYKNPRNLCSGSVRQLNNKITAERNVLFYAIHWFLLVTICSLKPAASSLNGWLPLALPVLNRKKSQRKPCTKRLLILPDRWQTMIFHRMVWYSASMILHIRKALEERQSFQETPLHLSGRMKRQKPH